MSQLLALLKPFSGRLVRPPAKGKYGDYVSHYVVEQRLLAVVGPYSWEITQTIREPDGTLTGCVGRITATIDGEERHADGAGDVENPGNQKTNGARLKLAESDAFKRAAMRFGVALHLWAGDDFYVYKLLKDSEPGETVLARERDLAGSDTGSVSSAQPTPVSSESS